MDADDAHEHEPQVAHHDAAVLDGVRHGEDPSPDVPLQHVDDHLRVRDLGPPILGLLDRRHLAGVPATNIYILHRSIYKMYNLHSPIQSINNSMNNERKAPTHPSLTYRLNCVS